MKETMSLLFATAILAAGGLGLYMYKNPSDKQSGGEDEDYNEDNLFDTNTNTNDHEHDYDEPEYYEPKTRTRGGKTKRSRKTSGTKRRY